MTDETAARTSGEAVFLAVRPHLLAVAYRMLGTVDDAEDVVQEAFERWHVRADRGRVEEPRALLTTVTTRLCIDRYRRERRRREAYPGPWLPEPLATPEDELVESVARDRLMSIGCLRLLEHLSPVERAVFVLAEAFDYRAKEIAAVVDRREAHCRQLLHRARRRLADLDGAAREPTGAERARAGRLLVDLADALERGAAEEAARLLADEVCLIGDGGGRVPAVSRPVHGMRAVLRLLRGFARQQRAVSNRPRVVVVNGTPSLALPGPDGLASLLVPESRGSAIDVLYVLRNPDKLARLADRAGDPS